MNKNFWYKIYIFCFGEIDRKYAINVLICFFYCRFEKEEGGEQCEAAIQINLLKNC